MNVGEQTLEWLYDKQLQVDGEWAVRGQNGFTWWAGLNAQTIEIVSEEARPDGDTGYVIAVRTEMVRDVDLTDQVLHDLNAGPMRTAAMAGPVYDPRTRTLSLCSLALVHSGNASWLKVLLSGAAVMQLTETMLLGPGLAEQLGAEQALTGHPEHGLREDPDEMAFTARVFAQEGQQPCRWPAEAFEAAVNEFMRRPPSLGASSGGAGLTVEFPYGDGSSLCQINGDQAHPLYGNGLFIVQRFPFPVDSEAAGAHLALSLNGADLTVNPAGYGFGSYVYVDGMVCFTGFIPNSFDRQAQLGNVYYSCATRARSLAVRLLHRDWDDDSFSLENSAIGGFTRDPKGH